MAAASRKRSREELDAHDKDDESSQTVVGDVDRAASQVKPADSQVDFSSMVLPSIPAHSTQPPVSSMAPPSQRPPQSGQRSQKAQSLQSTLAQQRKETEEEMAGKIIEPGSSDATIPDDDDAADASNASITPSEPQDRIVDFDWRSLQERYHKRMQELDRNEEEILQEFNQLCVACTLSPTDFRCADILQFFGVWASTSRTHEVDRSFKRLKTQMTYVQHEEDVLEHKRDHYIRVVDAFKSALQLLAN